MLTGFILGITLGTAVTAIAQLRAVRQAHHEIGSLRSYISELEGEGSRDDWQR